jgi:glycosyltransferase involved in cell wall biosynthesis
VTVPESWGPFSPSILPLSYLETDLPMTFCAANAFALPAISKATGGIPGIIKPGVNGFVFPPEEGAPTYGQAILDTFERRDRYAEMARASFAEFQERLNWRAFCRTFVQRASEVIDSRQFSSQR